MKRKLLNNTNKNTYQKTVQKFRFGITREILIKFVESDITIEQFAAKYNTKKQTVIRYLKSCKHNSIGITLHEYYYKYKNKYRKNTYTEKIPIVIDDDFNNLILGVSQASKLYTLGYLKNKYLDSGLIFEKCSKCGFCEGRVLDSKVPLVLNHIDGNKRNLKLDNIELLCYNCYYLYIGDVLGKKQFKTIEDFNTIEKLKEFSYYDLDELTLKKLEIDIYNKNSSSDDDPYSLVSYNNI